MVVSVVSQWNAISVDYFIPSLQQFGNLNEAK